MAARFSKPGLAYDGLAKFVILADDSRDARWTNKVITVPEKLDEPLHWRKPRRVFVNSMSDLFHKDVPFEFIAAVFGVMAACPQHTFQLLTKRPARMLEFFAWVSDGRRHAINDALRDLGVSVVAFPTQRHGMVEDRPWPLPNVHLGVSAEDQATADERIPLLLQCPAAIRWVSYEPALGFVDFEYAIDARERDVDHRKPEDGAWFGVKIGVVLDWIVIGGESGTGARVFDLDWAATALAETRDTDTRVFVKQLGARPLGLTGPLKLVDQAGGDMNEWPLRLRIREAPPCTDSPAWNAAMRSR